MRDFGYLTKYFSFIIPTIPLSIYISIYITTNMSREKPKTKYESVVTQFGNGAKIKAYKDHIGKKVKIEVEEDE